MAMTRRADRRMNPSHASDASRSIPRRAVEANAVVRPPDRIHDAVHMSLPA